MGALSLAQRRTLAAILVPPYGRIDLLCDGDWVSLIVLRYQKMSYRVGVYVDGTFMGKWCNPQEPCRQQRYLRRSERSFLTPANRVQFEKLYGKKKVANDPKFNRKFVWFCPDFVSGEAALAHLSRVCQDIREATEEELLTLRAAALAALPTPVEEPA